MSVAESPRLLKAHAARELGAKVVFNFEDVKQRCDAFVEQARRQTRQMISEATAEAESIRRKQIESAQAEGLQQGLQQAEDKIRRQAEQLAEHIVAERLATTLPALEQAVEELCKQRDCWLARWEAAAVELSVAIAEKLVHRQLSVLPGIGVETLRKALELAAGASKLRVRMHPQDIELLGARPEAYLQEVTSCLDIAVIPDEEITRGGCRVDTTQGVIDARLETQLRRIADELTGGRAAEAQTA